MSPEVNTALKGGQVFNSLVVLVLSSYVAYENNRSLIPSSTQINFLIFASSFSIIALLYLEAVPRISPRASPSPISILLVQAFVSGFFMAGFIALSVFLSRLLFCHGPVCAAARTDAVFAALSYAVWVASATITGIQISRANNDVKEIKKEKMVMEA